MFLVEAYSDAMLATKLPKYREKKVVSLLTHLYPPYYDNLHEH